MAENNVQFTKVSWQAIVDEARKNEPPEKDVAYKFSGGREFEREEDPYSGS